ncbi:hypothetical protein BU16DRAFT_188209 [Lophium mytilinum]|uniref:Uncharacterized protein n=1 Tax=Lophium mytilinum TaxID=390894 RepID=A0A6A6R8A2_9PEZI|nr:hypothetical protein BU16DRAFT_188209 [Lophium mytilinum]
MRRRRRLQRLGSSVAGEDNWQLGVEYHDVHGRGGVSAWPFVEQAQNVQAIVGASARFHGRAQRGLAVSPGLKLPQSCPSKVPQPDVHGFVLKVGTCSAASFVLSEGRRFLSSARCKDADPGHTPVTSRSVLRLGVLLHRAHFCKQFSASFGASHHSHFTAPRQHFVYWEAPVHTWTPVAAVLSVYPALSRHRSMLWKLPKPRRSPHGATKRWQLHQPATLAQGYRVRPSDSSRAFAIIVKGRIGRGFKLVAA